MSVTIRDVARVAGVSASTVSRTIRNNPAISETTKEKVRKAIEKVGYTAPASASTLVQNKPLVEVGIILPPSAADTYNNPFFLEVIRGISEYCNQNEAVSLLLTGRDDQEVIEAILSLSASSRLSAFILLFSRADDPIVDKLTEEGYDYVLIGSPQSRSSQTVSVDNDNIEAGSSAARYLYGLGHRRFAFIGSPFEHLFSASRKNGVLLFLQQAGIEAQNMHLIEMEHGDPEGLEEIGRLLALSKDKRPTAFVTSDDLHAMALRQKAAEAGLSIPDDLSIVSFNNSIFATLTSPRLTSIDVHPLQLGREAAAQAILRARTPQSMASKTLVPFVLVERESCAPAKS